MGVKRTKEDIAFSKDMRARYPACQRCGASEDNGRTKQLQLCHILSRTYKATRLDERNVVVMCSGCHFETTKDPIGFTLWLLESGLLTKEDYEDLRFLAGRKPYTEYL